jgi:chemotaxis protein MotB
MSKKCKCPEGVPEWVVTYGDMMSLLLCFFILLAAFSEIKEDDPKYQEVVHAIQEAFGFTGGSGRVPSDELPKQSVIEKMLSTALYREKIPKRSNTDDPGITGRDVSVRRIREGLQFTIGGLITFEPGLADLKPQAREGLARVINVIRGQNNKIEIRGHVDGSDLPPGASEQRAWDLSYARARAVMDHLVAEGIDPRRVRVTGCGDKEPLIGRTHDDPARSTVNRRVELIVTESLIQEFDSTIEANAVSLAPTQ